MRTLADLLADGDLRGKRVLVRSDLNVPLDGHDDHRRRPHPGVRPDDRGPRRGGRARRGLRPPRPAQGRAGGQVLARPGRDAPRRAARRPVAFATDTVGESATATVARGRPTATSCCWRTSGSTPARRPRTTPSGPRSPTQLAALADVFVSDGFGVVHRKQASVYDVARLLPHATGGLVSTEVDVLEAAHREPRAPVCGRARRREGVRQARGHRQPARHGRPAAHRRRDGVHLPRGPGPRGRQEPARGGPARHGPRLPRARRRARASRSSCPSTSSPPTAFSADADHEVVAADAIPADRIGLDIGPKSSALFAEKLERHAYRLLERPDGRVRDGPVCGGHQGARRGARRGHRQRRPDRRRRRRLRGRGARSSGSPTTSSGTSRPAAARASSTSRARSCPGLDRAGGERPDGAHARSSRATGR